MVEALRVEGSKKVGGYGRLLTVLTLRLEIEAMLLVRLDIPTTPATIVLTCAVDIPAAFACSVLT